MKENFLANFFIKEFTHWVSNQPDIQAAALVGSYARNNATQNSDIDLIIVADEPKKYIADDKWSAQFGVIHRQQWEDYDLVKSLRTWYERGLEVEFGITDPRWAAFPLDKGTRRVIKGGIRILFERGEMLSRHLS